MKKRTRRKNPQGVPQLQQVPISVSAKAPGDDAARIIRYVISDDSTDRDEDVIVAEGLDVSHFLKNPVFLWAHDSGSPPIGKVVDLTLSAEGQWIAAAQFLDPKDFADGSEVAQFADDIFRLYQQGVLSAVSIGFIPNEVEEIEESFWGWKIVTSELLELSAVPVQSNRNALAIRDGEGVTLDKATTARLERVNAWCKDWLESQKAEHDDDEHDDDEGDEGDGDGDGDGEGKDSHHTHTLAGGEMTGGGTLDEGHTHGLADGGETGPEIALEDGRHFHELADGGATGISDDVAQEGAGDDDDTDKGFGSLTADQLANRVAARTATAVQKVFDKQFPKAEADAEADPAPFLVLHP